MRRVDGHSDGEVSNLITRAKDGDKEAVESLLVRYRPLLLNNVRRLRRYIQGDVLSGDDLEQEATKIAIELFREYVPEAAGHFGSYLKQKLRWRLINYVRRERNRMRSSVTLDGDVCDNLVGELRAREGLEVSNPRLRAAMKHLSPKQRSVIFKMYWQERTAQEIASELNVTDESVRALRRRAEERIRKSYE